MANLADGTTTMARNGGGGLKRKGPWTEPEDELLTDHVRWHGEGNWSAVSRVTGLQRCGKSCRLRWVNHLRPNPGMGPFTPEEERLIVRLHGVEGNNWSRISAHLPGRSDNEIEKYWNFKRRFRAGLPLEPPDVELPRAQIINPFADAGNPFVALPPAMRSLSLTAAASHSSVAADQSEPELPAPKFI